MATKTIPLTAVSVQSAKANTRFGLLTYMPLSASPWAQMLANVSLAGIPSDAVITTATLVLRSRNKPNWSGTRTIKARAATSAFSTSTNWAGVPTDTATGEATRAIANATFGATWNLDVTSIVQAWVAGTLANRGFKIFTAETVAGVFQGTGAPWGAPVLLVDYQVPATAPTGLHPSSGAVSKNKPTLQFQTPGDTIAVQVQVDAAANGTTPGFDSGELALNAGLVDLSATSYAGLSDGASTQWRARVKNALGWSAWSTWVTFSRTSWKTLTISSPGSTSEDPSPTIQASYGGGGVVTAWRALLLSDTGAQVQDSGWTPGSTISFGTTKSVGAGGTAVVQIRDNVTRDATPGDPDYLEVTKAFTVTPSGTPTAPTLAAASSDGIKAEVVLTGTRSTIPDELVVYRNDILVDRVTGASVFSGTNFTYRDRTAPMNVPATYKVFAVSAGAWSSASATKGVTPSCLGIWLYDTLSSDAVLILDDEELDQTQPEVAIVHRPISGPGGNPQVVRRRLARYPREGLLEGTLVDAVGVSAATSESVLRDWADNDAGRRYRLVLGNQNDPVILGDITFEELSENGTDRVLGVSASWWYQG
jgi:hypothetical protein